MGTTTPPIMSTSTVITIITDAVNDVGSVLTDGLPIVFALVFVLVGLGFLTRFLYKKFGSPKRM